MPITRQNVLTLDKLSIRILFVNNILRRQKLKRNIQRDPIGGLMILCSIFSILIIIVCFFNFYKFISNPILISQNFELTSSSSISTYNINGEIYNKSEKTINIEKIIFKTNSINLNNRTISAEFTLYNLTVEPNCKLIINEENLESENSIYTYSKIDKVFIIIDGKQFELYHFKTKNTSGYLFLILGIFFLIMYVYIIISGLLIKNKHLPKFEKSFYIVSIFCIISIIISAILIL